MEKWEAKNACHFPTPRFVFRLPCSRRWRSVAFDWKQIQADRSSLRMPSGLVFQSGSKRGKPRFSWLGKREMSQIVSGDLLLGHLAGKSRQC